MNYEAYFDELNVMTTELVNNFNKKRLENRDAPLDELLDFIEDNLLASIAVGVLDANEDLATEYALDAVLTGHDINELIYEEVAGETWVERILNLAMENEISEARVKRIVETESHRVINEAKMATARKYKGTTGADVMKKWITRKDERVRATHDGIDDEVIPLDSYFHTFDGDSAQYPGGFNNAENNINCRCVVKLI